jgi:hypothetical protein
VKGATSLNPSWHGRRALCIIPGRANFVGEADGVVWIGTSEGTWTLVDGDIRVSVRNAAVTWWTTWLLLFFPDAIFDGDVTIDAEYVGHDAERLWPSQLSAVLEGSKPALDAAVAAGKYSFRPLLDTSWSPTEPFQTFHVAVRDPHGNHRSFTFERLVLPGTTAASVSLGLLCMVLFSGLIVAAPFSRACNAILMNPFARTIGTFCYVQALLYFVAPVRRHLLRRYRRSLRRSDGIRDAIVLYVPPSQEFDPDVFLRLLLENRRVLLRADSGMGKSALLRAVAARAAGRCRALPVLINLAQYEGTEPEAMIRAQLKNFGGITDDRLADWMITNGGLLLLFDGLNEVGAATRRKVARFVDANWQDNWIVAASQQAYPEFQSWPKRAELAALDAEGVARIVRRRLPSAQAEAAVARLTRDRAPLVTRPQDLMLALRLVERDPDLDLPASHDELYAAAFRARFKDWRRSGKADFPDILVERAYVMLRDRDANLLGGTASAAELPPDVMNFLIEERFAIRQDGAMFFVHDLVRAYLASLHFIPNWRTLLEADGKDVEANWLSMLQFTLRRMARHLPPDQLHREALALASRLLEVNDFVAGLVVAWSERELPQAGAGWREDFYRRYGETSAKRSLALLD